MRDLLRATLLFCCLGLVPLSHGQTAKDSQIAMDTQRALHEDQYDALIVGDREVPLIVAESTTPITRGVAVIVGEAGEGPFSQHTLAPLAEELNQYGWVTMTMAAPSQGFFDFSVPEAAAKEDMAETDAGDMNEEAAEQQGSGEAESDEDGTQETSEDSSEESAGQASPVRIPPPPPPAHPGEGLTNINEDDFNAHEQQLQEQMQAVVSRSSQYPGFFLVIAQGTSGAWLTKLYAEQGLASPDALVVVNPYWPQREYNQTLPTHVAATSMPLLDIYSPWDNGWGQLTVAPRRVAAEKGLKLHYRQRELIGQAMDTEQFRLLGKEIYGWLTYLGW